MNEEGVSLSRTFLVARVLLRKVCELSHDLLILLTHSSHTDLQYWLEKSENPITIIVPRYKKHMYNHNSLHWQEGHGPSCATTRSRCYILVPAVEGNSF